MPTWLRLFHIQKINEFNQEQNEKMEKANKGQTQTPNKVVGPNIPPPSSTYDF